MTSDVINTEAATPDFHRPATTKKKSNRKLYVRILSIGVTVALLLFLFSKLDWERFIVMLGSISLGSGLIALISYGAQNYFRAIRFRVLLDKRDAPMRLLLPITLYHNFLVRVLPFKLGELSYILMLRNRLNYAVEAGVSSLFGARILELMIIVLMTTIGLLLSSDHLTDQTTSLMVIIPLLFIACIASIYFAGTLVRFGTNILRRLINLLPTVPGFVDGLLAKFDDVASSMDTLRQPQLFLKSFLISFLTYGSAVTLNYVLLTAVGVDVPLPVMITIISIGQFAAAFPFSVSGFGVVEGGWALGLVLFTAIPGDDAIAIGFLLHGFQILAATLYGLIGYLAVRMQPSYQEQTEPTLST